MGWLLFFRRIMEEYINRKQAIEMIKYSSRYNAPCPQWVYKVLENMTGITVEEPEDQSTSSQQ